MVSVTKGEGPRRLAPPPPPTARRRPPPPTAAHFIRGLPDMLQSLSRISQPSGAIAVFNQESRSESVGPPRGMAMDGKLAAKSTRLMPGDTAALHFYALYSGFMATRTVVACETALELPMLLAAETKELLDAAKGVVAPDNSLPPRHVSVTLLAHGTNAVQTSGARMFLDGLAHLASSPIGPVSGNRQLTATLMRVTVLAGADAAWHCEQIKDEALDSAPEMAPGTVQLCARWVAQLGGLTTRTEFKTFNTATTADLALEAMQNWLFSLKIAYAAPFPVEIASRHANVPPDAWAKSVHNASHAFFALFDGRQTVKLQKHGYAVQLEHSGVHVRICPRLDPMLHAVNRPDSFHGFLIGSEICISEIQRHCKQNEERGLPMTTEDTAKFCLHTVAVQAVGFPLEQRVSLYAVSGKCGGMKPGVPIQSPGSWVWRHDPAIVPLEDVLQNFHVVPCNRESLLPGDRRLERPFGTFFNKAYKLFSNTFENSTTTSCGEDIERLPISIPTRPPHADPRLEAEERYALSAFGLNAASQRIAVGDAFAALSARQAPKELREFMLQSALRMGINTSILDAMSTASALMATRSATPESHKLLTNEVKRLKRVADAALLLHVATPKKPKNASIDATGVRLLLKTANLKQSNSIVLPQFGEADGTHYSVFVQFVANAVLDSTDIEKSSHDQACHVAKASHNTSVLNAICAATCVLRATPHVQPSTVFILTSVEDNQRLSFNRVSAAGGFEESSPGAVLDAPVRSVLVVKMCKGAAKITVAESVA